MFGSFSLAILLSLSAAAPADFEPLVRDFVEAFKREDREAVRGTAPLRPAREQAKDFIFIYDRIEIDSYRITSVEQRAEEMIVNVEIVGRAVTANTGEPDELPRWWSLAFRQNAGKWELVNAPTLERRLAGDLFGRPHAEQTTRLREHPQIDRERFAEIYTSFAEPGAEGCNNLTWLLGEFSGVNEPASESAVYQALSYIGVAGEIHGQDAVANSRRAIVLAEIDGRPETIADAYFALGIALWLGGGNMADGAAALRHSATFYDKVADPRLPIRAQYMAGWMSNAQNKLREALVDAQLMQKMVGGLATDHERMTSAFQIASVHDRLGNYDVSRQFYETARELAVRTGFKEEEAVAIFNIAANDMTLKGPAAARAGLEKAYDLTKGGTNAYFRATIATYLGMNLQQLGDFERAERVFDEAVSLAQQMAGSVNNFGTLFVAHVARGWFRLAQGRPEEALADARASYAKLDKPKSDALAIEGRALRMLSQTDEAERVLRAAVDFVELELSERLLDDTGSATVIKEKLAPYRELLDLYVDHGCPREALTVAERMRARSLRDSLRNGRVDLSAGLDETRRARELELERAIADVNRHLLAANNPEEIAKLQGQRDQARIALRRFRSELYAMHPALARRRPETSEQYESWKPFLAPGEVAVELAVGDEQTLVFVVEGTSIRVHRVDIRREELERQVDELVDALEHRDLTYRASARSLHDLLLGKVQLAGAKSLRIVPDGALWRLPFHALIDRGGKHLVDRLPVAYSPSLALARMRTTRANAPRTLLAMGDPTIGNSTANATQALYRDVKLGRLPDAASEARAIARLYSGSKVRTGADARESAFKDDAAAFRILHLAAHSIVDDRAPLFSSIVLAAADNNALEDGLLEAREIADLELNADIAVLSACETARGAVAPGEGMIGLSWAFLAAGVPTTVVSQWKVGSASTADLMIGFHRELREGAAPAAALREAMLRLRNDPKWRHPFYWAPFVVIENGNDSATERQ